ncbi:MAG: alpha/beta fold hydrolase, partial [Synergistaceae bacterium]|nr:alpha/beta fold hydrolase [Synergistaceae bacterium]
MKKVLCALILLSFAIPASALSIKEQGIFSAGGVVLSTDGTFDPVHGQFDPKGQTHHADHANVLYQIPEGSSKLPMVFLHGYGQSRMGWMTTPDGRPGWSDIFLRKGYGVYLVDQPRRGEAGQTSKAAEISTLTQDQNWYTQFRIGLWPKTYEGSQFPDDPESLNQFFRQMTPNTGDFDVDVIVSAFVKIFERCGDGILFTHSQGGGPGWNIA